jgi:hypothetical protein
LKATTYMLAPNVSFDCYQIQPISISPSITTSRLISSSFSEQAN